MWVPPSHVRTVNLILGGRKLSIKPHSNINVQDDLFQNTIAVLTGYCFMNWTFHSSRALFKKLEKEKDVGSTPCDSQRMMSIPPSHVRTVNLIFGGRKLSIKPHSNINVQDDLFQNTIAVLKGYCFMNWTFHSSRALFKKLEKEKDVGSTPCDSQRMMSILPSHVRAENLIFVGRKLSIKPHCNLCGMARTLF
jgi:hypothetical protein